MSDAYDLRSNIKGKKGSQGTLFQVKDKGLLNPQQRWPRGYTPERQADVAGALKSVPMRGSSPDQRTPYQNSEQRARVIDTVSRSTMPTKHLAGLTGISRPQQRSEGREAAYFPMRKAIEIDMSVGAQNDGDKNLIHELGHHVDHQNFQPGTGTRDKAVEVVSSMAPEGGYKNETSAHMAAKNVVTGIGEAVADNYHTEHYRTRGKNPQPVTRGRYEENFTPAHREEQYPGYNEVRPPLINPDQFKRQGSAQGRLF